MASKFLVYYVTHRWVRFDEFIKLISYFVYKGGMLIPARIAKAAKIRFFVFVFTDDASVKLQNSGDLTFKEGFNPSA